MNALLWWFGQNTLTVLLIVPCVMLACRMFRDRPTVQHLLWLVILLKFVTPPIVAWPWATVDWHSLLGSQDSSIRVVTHAPVAAGPFSDSVVSDAIPMEPSITANEFVATPLPIERTEVVPVVADIGTPTPPLTAQVPWSRVVPLMALSVWLLGALMVFAMQLRRWIRFAHLVRGGDAAPSHLNETVSSVAPRLRTKAPVCVVVKGIKSPFLWCAVAVRLAWPDSISGPDDVVHCRGIIAHELAHLRRRDHWITWLELGASVLWWWNPLFWFVRRRLREAAEMSCDALAIASDPECRHGYAQQLLQLSTQSQGFGPATALAVGSGTAASFERRLRMILSPKTSGKLSWKGGLVMVVLTFIALPYWSFAQSSSTESISLPGSEAFSTKGTDDRSVFGVVVDTRGTPIAGVKVQAAMPRFANVRTEASPVGDDIVGKATVTDSKGRFHIIGIPISQSPWAVFAENVMLRMRSPYRWVDDACYKLDKDLRIVMRGSGKQGTLRLRLVDEQSRTPVSNFTVVRRHDPVARATVSQTGDIDLTEKFVWDDSYWMYCYADGYEAKSIQAEAFDPESDQRAEVRMKPRPSLRVQFVEQKSGSPIASAQIMAARIGSESDPAQYIAWGEINRYVDGYHPFDFVQRKATDREGFVSFSQLPKGKLSLFALVDGYQRVIVRPADREQYLTDKGQLQIGLEPEASIVGRLTRNGQPRANVRVPLRTSKMAGLVQWMEGTQTDADGRYRLRSLVPGDYRLEIAGRTQRVSIGEQEYEHNYDWKLEPESTQIDTSQQAKTQVVPQVPEVLKTVAEDKSSEPASDDGAQTASSDYEGTVLDPNGKPLPDANVYVISHWNEATKLGPVRATSDADGKFAFDAEDMTWQQLGTTRRRGGLIVASKPGFVPEWMETWGDSRSIFRTGLWGPLKKTPIELQLARDDVPIHGQLLDDNGKPLVGVRVRLTRVMVPRKRDLTAFLDHWLKAPTSATFLTGIPYKRELAKHFELLNVKSEHVTDAEGRFELSGVGRDRIVQLEFTSPSIVATSVQVMTRNADDVGLILDRSGKPTWTLHGAKFTFTPQQGFTVTGVVRDSQTKRPIAGMWIARRYNPLTSPKMAATMPVTDANGRFTITGLNPKLLDYDAKHRGVNAVPQPGTQFLKSSGTIERDGELIIESERGINYRLSVVDEDGKAVDATVEYHPINPNTISADLIRRSVNHAAQRSDGIYEGFVVPGPGAILVKVRSGRYRPTFVDPKAFFAPGKTWDDNSRNTYGTYNTLAGVGGWNDQRSYAAIVLVNPVKDAQPLNLTATLTRDQPRIVSLVDSERKQVTDARALFHQWSGISDSKMELTAATFPVYGLATNYDQEITFTHQERKLVGHLSVPAGDDSALTVTLQPWATITGRFVDASGNPIALPKRGQGFSVTNESVPGSRSFRKTIDKGARFRVEQIVPGHRYSFQAVYLRTRELTPVDVFKNLAFQSGEVRDLGDIVVTTQPE